MVESGFEPQDAPSILHYSCKKCRAILFKPEDLQEHTSAVKDIKAPVKK